MTEIIEAIDAWTLNRYGIYNEKLYGFCELMRKTAGENSAEQVFPVTIPDRKQVSLDDRYNFITWMRWIQPATYEASEEWSFGNTEARVGTVPIRLVLAHRTTLGEDLVFDFINAFPSKFKISGFQFVFVDGRPSIDPDHEAIYTAELGNTVYEKHRFTWNIYLLNINVQFLECVELTP
jgi:hypothetical protein